MSQAGKNALEERLGRAIEAYHEAALLYAAVKLGLAEAMGTRAWTTETLAAALGLSLPHLARFLRGLCIVGICVERADGGFVLTPLGQSLTSDSRLAQKVRIVVEQYWQPWASLTATLQTGTPAFAQIFGASVFDWRRDHPEQGAMFSSYLAKTTQTETEAILAALDVSDSDRVVVLGGADTFPATVSANADLYVLNGVLQNYGDEDAVAILRRCRAAMPDGARLVIVERLMPENAMDDPAAVMLDLHMMTITGGRARSFAEIETLLSDAGLSVSKATTTLSGLTVIESTVS
jgi:hypothetical protein